MNSVDSLYPWGQGPDAEGHGSWGYKDYDRKTCATCSGPALYYNTLGANSNCRCVPYHKEKRYEILRSRIESYFDVTSFEKRLSANGITTSEVLDASRSSFG